MEFFVIAEYCESIQNGSFPRKAETSPAFNKWHKKQINRPTTFTHAYFKMAMLQNGLILFKKVVKNQQKIKHPSEPGFRY